MLPVLRANAAYYVLSAYWTRDRRRLQELFSRRAQRRAPLGLKLMSLIFQGLECLARELIAPAVRSYLATVLALKYVIVSSTIRPSGLRLQYITMNLKSRLGGAISPVAAFLSR